LPSLASLTFLDAVRLVLHTDCSGDGSEGTGRFNSPSRTSSSDGLLSSMVASSGDGSERGRGSGTATVISEADGGVRLAASSTADPAVLPLTYVPYDGWFSYSVAGFGVLLVACSLSNIVSYIMRYYG
jgi:hypothetical protein